jgi:hypothetical protein
MSIFSRLRKRGAEDEGPVETAPSAPPIVPAPAPRMTPTTPPAPPARAPETVRPPPREPVRAPVAIAPPRGNVQTAAAGTIAAAPAPAAARPSLAVAKPAAPLPGLAPAPAAMTARAAPERPAPAAPPPAARPPVASPEPTGGSLDVAIARALENSSVRRAAAMPAAPVKEAEPPAPPSHGASTEFDEAALRETFEALAVAHVTPVRNAMMEVRFGEAQTSWLELGRPALKSLRNMASEVGHPALVAALDGFVGALQAVLEPGQPSDLTGPTRDTLLAAYAPLASCLPRAFALEGERDRREPIVVRALLDQVTDLEPLMVDKMMAAGLGTLAALFAARADEIAAVTGIPDAVAAAVAARIQAFRRANPAALATVDPAATIRELSKLIDQLRAEHTAFEEAARGWSPDARLAKKQLRRQRQTTFLQVTIALVRLGEIDFALRLPKLAFGRRLDDLERIVASRAAAVRQPAASRESGPHPVAA